MSAAPAGTAGRSRLLSRLLGLLIAAGVGAGLFVAFRPQPVLVDMAEIATGDVLVTVSEDGRTRIKERYVVASPLSGRLLRIRLDPGDDVIAGETLVAAIEPMDPTLLDARALAESEARVKAAEARLKQSDEHVQKSKHELEFQETELARIDKLAAQGPKTRTDLERAQLAYRTAEQDYRSSVFAREIAEYELQLARAALMQTRPEEEQPESADLNFSISSPITGRVLRVFQESSRVIAPGENLLEVGDPSDLEVVVDVLSSDAVQIEPGAEVRLQHWGGTESLSGTVRLVEPSGFTKISALGVEEQRVNVVIDFLDPPAARANLGDGFRVEADIVLWEGTDVLRVPTSALFRAGGEWAVFVVEDGIARLRPVKVGHRNGLEAEVLDGLQAGDTVIVHPGDTVRDGERVAPRSGGE